MKKLIWIVNLALISSLGVACGDDGGETTGDTDMPALSTTQIDRMGRPAIATALQATFTGDTTAQQAARKTYNENRDVSSWQAAFAGQVNTDALGDGFVGSIAILESIGDSAANGGAGGAGNKCGDHDLINLNPFDEDPAPTEYVGLAKLLADDQLYLDSTKTTCAQYLAVELGVTTDCGGRAPEIDVIDTSYSALALGKAAGVGDGVAEDGDGKPSATFPFLNDPH